MLTSMQFSSFYVVSDSLASRGVSLSGISKARYSIALGLMGIGSTIAMSVIANDCFHGGDRFPSTCKNTPIKSCHTYTTGSGSNQTTHTICNYTGRNYSPTKEGTSLAIGAGFIALASVLLLVKGVSMYLESRKNQQEQAERVNSPSSPSANDLSAVNDNDSLAISINDLSAVNDNDPVSIDL